MCIERKRESPRKSNLRCVGNVNALINALQEQLESKRFESSFRRAARHKITDRSSCAREIIY